MTLLTPLYKALLIISIASLFIYFYTVKIIKEENSRLMAANTKIEEKIKDNAQVEEEKREKELELEQKIQELEKKNNSEVEEGKEFCEQKTNIVFLKTHKTAGSTVQRLFLRFAENNQLIVVKPVHPLEVTKFRRCQVYPLKPGNEYNLLALHTKFNYQEMKDVMPEDTKFITILREPAAQFESAYSYFSLEKFYGMNIATYADLNTSLPKWSRIKNLRKDKKYGLNSNAFDLGLDPELFDDEEAILQKVQELDRQFHLVMITELFYESMILMKEMLCWKKLINVVGIDHNVRSASVKVSLSSEQKMKLREKNRADLMIYDHFRRKLLKQIDAFGKERMAEEVRKLRALTREMRELCLEPESSSPKKIQKMPRMKAGAEEHEVCRAIDEKRGWKKFSKSKFADPIECQPETAPLQSQ